MFCTDLIKLPNHIYMQYYNNPLPCNTHFILHISTFTSKFIQLSLVPFLDALQWKLLLNGGSAPIPSLLLSGIHFSPLQAGLALLALSSLSLTAEAHWLWLGSGLAVASPLPILIAFLFFLPADCWEKCGQSSDSVLGRQTCPVPPCSRFPITAPLEICYSGSS